MYLLPPQDFRGEPLLPALRRARGHRFRESHSNVGARSSARVTGRGWRHFRRGSLRPKQLPAGDQARRPLPGRRLAGPRRHGARSTAPPTSRPSDGRSSDVSRRSRAIAQGSTPEAYLELLRSDVRTSKVEFLTGALNLPEQEAAAVWPIFREYDPEPSKLGDRRVATVKAFAKTYGTATNEQASLFAKDWFALRSDRLKLRQSCSDKVAKAVSPLAAARFTQVENVIGMLIDIQAAAELPLME